MLFLLLAFLLLFWVTVTLNPCFFHFLDNTFMEWGLAYCAKNRIPYPLQFRNADFRRDTKHIECSQMAIAETFLLTPDNWEIVKTSNDHSHQSCFVPKFREIQGIIQICGVACATSLL